MHPLDIMNKDVTKSLIRKVSLVKGIDKLYMEIHAINDEINNLWYSFKDRKLETNNYQRGLKRLLKRAKKARNSLRGTKRAIARRDINRTVSLLPPETEKGAQAWTGALNDAGISHTGGKGDAIKISLKEKVFSILSGAKELVETVESELRTITKMRARGYWKKRFDRDFGDMGRIPYDDWFHGEEPPFRG